MSWLARSLANSLRLDPHNDVVPSSTSYHPPAPPPPLPSRHRQDDDSDTQSEEEAQSRGVKEDLSELGQTLTRQFWGVASFLAPPTDSGSAEEEERESTEIRSGFADIGGRFRSGASEISTMASNSITEEEIEEEVLERNEESEECFDDDVAVVGITHEVLAFARNIAMHPETWLDFPLDEEEEPDDFDMSEAQHEHAFAIEQFSPQLAALRIELCPCHMSLGYFWKVYFVLLHSRLNKYDAEILSTPQVMEARAKWMKELHERTKPNPDYSARRSNSNYRDEFNSAEEDDYCPSENMPFWSFSSEPTMSCANTDYETEKHPVASTEIPLIDKSVIEEEQQVSKTKDIYPQFSSSSKIAVPNCEDDDDDQWLQDEDLDLHGYGTAITMGNEDDISFSDLEDDDNFSFPKKSNIISKDYGSSLTKS